MIEVDGHDYDAVSELTMFEVRVSALEVQQRGGLIGTTRKALAVEGLSSMVMAELGLEGPSIRVFVQKED